MNDYLAGSIQLTLPSQLLLEFGGPVTVGGLRLHVDFWQRRRSSLFQICAHQPDQIFGQFFVRFLPAVRMRNVQPNVVFQDFRH